MSKLYVRRCGNCGTAVLSLERQGAVLCDECVEGDITLEIIERQKEAKRLEERMAREGQYRMYQNARCHDPKCACRRVIGGR